MIRSLAAGASLALALVLAPAAMSASVPAIPVNSGDRITGDLDTSTDRDDFSILVPEGARLVVSVSAPGKSPLLPNLEIHRPDGTAVSLLAVLQGEGTRTITLPGTSFTETGTYTVTIRGFASTSGAYAASIGLVVEGPIKETVVVPAGGTVKRPFTAWDGLPRRLHADGEVRTAARGFLRDGSLRRDRPRLRRNAQGHQGLGQGDPPRRRRRRLRPRTRGRPGGRDHRGRQGLRQVPQGRQAQDQARPEPRPTSFAPPTGLGGATVTVSGTGFVANSRILFDGVAEATDVVLTPQGTLTGKCPVYTGSDEGDETTVAVANPDGQVGTLEQHFKFVGIPALSYTTPTISPLAGGITVTVHGTRFRPGAVVRFGGVDATNVVILSGDTLTCVNPAHASANVQVTVVDEFSRPSPAPLNFDYVDPPVVTTVSPGTIPSFGGQTMTVTGSEFLPGDRVFMGGVESTLVTVSSRTSLTFKAPAGSAGPNTVEVRDVLNRSGFKVGAVTLTESFVDVSATNVPAFAAGSDFPGQFLAVGDLSGDGLPDILVSSAIPHVNTQTKAQDNGSFMLQDSAGGIFTDATSSKIQGAMLSAGDKGQADALSIGDLDSNGVADIVISRAVPQPSSSSTISFQGYPCYYFAANGTSIDPMLRTASRMLSAAVNGAFSDTTSTRVLVPTSTPCFGTGERWQAAASAIGDLDGDGDQDLLLVGKTRVDNGTIAKVTWTYRKVPAYYGGYYYYKDKGFLTQTVAQVGSARILRNTSSVQGKVTTLATRQAPIFSAAGTTLLDQFSADACAVGDLDGDGFQDAILLSKSPVKKEVSAGVFANASALRILFSNNVAKLTFDGTALPAVYEDAHAGSGDFWQGTNVFLGDLDGDNKLDIIVGRDAATYWTDAGSVKHLLPAVRIFRNLGSRKFSEDTGSFLADNLFKTGGPATLLGARGVAFKDVDRDGKKDLVVTSRIADVTDAGNGFGINGILPAGQRSATRVLLKNASGKFVDDTDTRFPPASFGRLFQADCIGMADFNADGKMDIVLAMDIAPGDGSRPVKVLLAK